MPRILIVDDDSAIREALGLTLTYEKYEILEAASGEEALRRVEAELPDLVLLDIKMPGMDGLDVLRRLQERHPETPVVMVSAHGTIATAVECTRQGAADFVEKPLDRNRLLVSVRSALDRGRLARENRGLRARLRRSTQILGGSRAIRVLLALIDRVAPTDARVLIRGENGAGKELVARAIHERSRRSGAPFVDINCAALPGELVESELFGYEEGAFTGARRKQQGRFVEADGGTLFLDEIGDMPIEAQAKVLRVLEEESVRPLGVGRNVAVDVRVVSATNQDLPARVREGRFREDLLFRLNVFPIHVPPLRDRREDIPILAEAFLDRFCARSGWERKPWSEDAMALLQAADWPGNVRELRSAVERVAILAGDEGISPAHVHAALSGDARGVDDPFAQCTTFEEFRVATERKFLQTRLAANQGNVSQTAQELRMPRSNLYKKMERYGLKPPPSSPLREES